MAKQIKPGSCMWRVTGGNGAPLRLMVESYNLDDGADATIQGYNQSGVGVADPPQRDLTTAEKAMTVSEFYAAREAAINTAESIS